MEDLRENNYSCLCPEGKKGKCSGKSSRLYLPLASSAPCLNSRLSPPPLSDGHSLTFSGSSYVKYHLIENENKELLKLSLRLRTFSSHATVMYAKGTDYSILEVGLSRNRKPFLLFRGGSGGHGALSRARAPICSSPQRRRGQKVKPFRMRGCWNAAVA